MTLCETFYGESVCNRGEQNSTVQIIPSSPVFLLILRLSRFTELKVLFGGELNIHTKSPPKNNPKKPKTKKQKNMFK